MQIICAVNGLLDADWFLQQCGLKNVIQAADLEQSEVKLYNPLSFILGQQKTWMNDRSLAVR